MIADRIDVIRDKFIRFTQPALFNDPFESLPVLKSFGPDSNVYKAILNAIDDIDEVEWEKIPEEDKLDITMDEFKEYVRQNPNRALQIFRDSESNVLPYQRSKLYNLINNAVGILSLAEQPDNLLMWAHYANHHKGYVLGLDSKHEFFTPIKEPEDPINTLEKVTYTNKRPEITLTDVTERDLFLYKSKKWKYEKEWRFLRYLTDSDKTITRNNQECHLFKLPPACSRVIIFGCRMKIEVTDNFKSILRDDSSLKHVKIFQAKIDSEKYMLRNIQIAL